MGQVPVSPSRDTHNNTLELLCWHWNPHQLGEVNCLLPTSKETADLLEPQGWECWLPLTSPPANQNNVQSCSCRLWTRITTLLTTCSKGTHSFGHFSLLWPSLAGKVIKLFFPTSPKTLSPRFNSVSWYRGRIQLHSNRSTHNIRVFLPKSALHCGQQLLGHKGTQENTNWGPLCQTTGRKPKVRTKDPFSPTNQTTI